MITMWQYHTLDRMAKIEDWQYQNDKVVEKLEPPPPLFASGNVNWYSHFGKQHGGFLKTQTYTSDIPSNSTPGRISKRHET